MSENYEHHDTHFILLPQCNIVIMLILQYDNMADFISSKISLIYQYNFHHLLFLYHNHINRDLAKAYKQISFYLLTLELDLVVMLKFIPHIS